MNLDPVLGHQGGWDEVLILLSPVAVFVLLRFLERRRRSKAATAPSSDDEGSSGTGSPPDP